MSTNERFIEILKKRFLSHFELLPGVDPAHTNHELIDSLFPFYVERPVGITEFRQERRGMGVTRTLIEWAKWIDDPVLSITQHPRMWNKNGIKTQPWYLSMRGIREKGMVVIVDNAANHEVRRSLVLSKKFHRALSEIPYPSFHVF